MPDRSRTTDYATALPSAETVAKEGALKALISGYGSLAVAYSGGVDSTYLADVAHEVLGPQARMVIADTPSIPRAELAEAAELAQKRHWTLVVITTHEFEDEAYLRNDANRCYYCKTELFSKMQQYAAENGIAVLAYGETADDTFDTTRVGHIAAGEQAVAAPLKEVGLKKAEIRQLSRQRNLPTAEKASFACLASRIPTGARLSVAELAKVERAEDVLKRLGFQQYRARHHGDLCRIEIDPADFAKMLSPEVRTEIVARLAAVGYRHVALDLAGYRTASMAKAKG